MRLQLHGFSGKIDLVCLLLCCSGKCFEVQCVKKDFKDGYGAYLSRSSACKDESKRVVVKITDSVSAPAHLGLQQVVVGCGRAPGGAAAL